MYIRIGIILYLLIELECAKSFSKSDVFNNLSRNNLTNNSKGSGLWAILDNSINDSSYPEYDSEDETYFEEGNNPEDENYSEKDNDSENYDWGCELSDMPPKPGSKCCGIDVSFSPRITDGEPTLLNQYPWLALIEYENPIGELVVGVSCGGSLISGSYVLTAAHCATIDIFKPSNAVLGDYNKAYNGQDCVLYPNGDKLCSKGEVRIRIEKVIPHQFYTEGTDFFSGLAWNHNDIALMKLQQIVSYTESVRPICLPTSDLTKASKRFLKKLNLTAAGWGYKINVPYGWTFKGIESDVKRHVRLPYVSLETCKNVFGHATDYHVCAGGEKGKDTCNGDSGGPLMFSKHGQFELTGITSYGETNPCGNGSPGVYTNVYRYKRWIMDVIKYGDTE